MLEAHNHFLFFRNKKLKHKLVAVLMLSTLLISLVVVVCLQYVFEAYDAMLYAQSAQTINNSISDIENEINNINKLSLTIATDTRIQEQLTQVKHITNEYERAQVLKDFKNKIFVYMLTEDNISSIRFVNDYGYDFMLGQSEQMPREREKLDAIAKAKAAKGANVWIEPDAAHPYLLAAREILSTGTDLLDPLGTLIFQVNLKSVVLHHESATDNRSALYIWKEDQPIYVPDPLFQFDRALAISDQGYEISKVNGSRYFISYTQSPDTGWTFYSVMSYKEVFKKKNDLRVTLLTVISLLLITVVAVSYRLAKGITKPIEHLTSQMRRAEKGDFELIVADLPEKGRSDEVGYLQRRFSIMIQRIEELIEENYTRQILLKDTEYRALQAQINPHFLYNTLTSINWVARLNNQAAISNMVESLSRLLRNAISNNEQVNTLGEEIKLLQDYIYIQKVRYGNELQFILHMDESYYSYRIPKMSLQPIVENAIKHGYENMLGECQIEVTAASTDAFVEITIKDNGPGMDEASLAQLRKMEYTSKGTGIGLKNIHERLRHMAGESAGLLYESTPGQGTAVTLRLPRKGEKHV